MNDARPQRGTCPGRLIAFPIAFCLFDLTATLIGQPAAYWAGDYGAIEEWNPIPRAFLSISPLLFIGAVMAWIALFSYFIAKLPRRFAIDLAMVVIVGHGLGVFSWLRKIEPFGLVLGFVFVGAAIAATFPMYRRALVS